MLDRSVTVNRNFLSQKSFIWYTGKEGYPLSKFQIVFLALISATERFGQQFGGVHITINCIPPLMSFGHKSGKFSIFMLTAPGSSHLAFPQALWGNR